MKKRIILAALTISFTGTLPVYSLTGKDIMKKMKTLQRLHPADSQAYCSF